MLSVFLTLLSITTSGNLAVAPESSHVDCKVERKKLIKSLKPVPHLGSVKPAKLDSDPATLELFLMQNTSTEQSSISEDGQAVYISEKLRDEFAQLDMVISAIDKQLFIKTGGYCATEREKEKPEKAVEIFQTRTKEEQSNIRNRCEMLSGLVQETYQNKLDGKSVEETKFQLIILWAKKINMSYMLDAQTDAIYAAGKDFNASDFQQKSLDFCLQHHLVTPVVTP